MSIGTGFGLAMLLYGKGKMRVMQSEGWRMFVAADPQDEVQQKLALFIFQKLKKPSSLCRLMKGSSILSLYQFLEKDIYPELKNNYVGQKKKLLKSK
eukprot:CAMPEP_0202964910 /NCGR_PEP_ID=MMETSP1396-20130829/9040_1 /ASSEMBLY_ACC=CAM_ASM_000872 /TAXON_ID= /ORGANISM="Pseudokeronopsis sp., Strain Brazil" /LENGTH=96 /DNA_ID=CAMNT_0049687427 /DNA_START=431 /DNA_END=721 /DNA_ORIENTATION=-